MKILIGLFALFAISGPSCLKLGNVKTKPITKQSFNFAAGKLVLIDPASKTVAETAATRMAGAVKFNRIAHRKGHPIAIYYKQGLKTKVEHEYTYIAPDSLQRILDAKTEAEFKKELGFPAVLASNHLIANLWTRSKSGQITPVRIQASVGIQTLLTIGISEGNASELSEDGIKYWLISVGKPVAK